jgi:Lrp/AsnC family leucine-responsive transcriptional regulator
VTEENDILVGGKLDSLDRRLITELQADPRLAYATLGNRLGVTGMTAANRLQRLRQAGLLRLRAVPHFENCGLTTQIQALVQVELSAIDHCIEILDASPFVLRMDRVTGEYDISFHAAFPNETAMGSLVRELQSVAGIRRLVVHHSLETLKDDDGWSAVWSDSLQPEEATFEIAAGARIPEHLRSRVDTAAEWLVALVEANIPRLRELSEPDITFTIMPPYAGAGSFEGIEAVEEEARLQAASTGTCGIEWSPSLRRSRPST